MTVYSPLATPSATRETLTRHGLSAKYALGQNFLVNDGVVGKICELSGVCADDAVLEVGPGIGTLTIALATRAHRVIAVERDPDLPSVLADTLSGVSNVDIISKDALDLREGDWGDTPPNAFIANLPYAVAATLILDVFQRFSCIERACVMVQKEVADRIAAHIGTKDYGAYTVKLGMYATPAGRFNVSPGSFLPAPRVQSSVIRLDRVHEYADHEIQHACIAADAAFAARRKTISNSMQGYFKAHGAAEYLASAGQQDVGSAVRDALDNAGINARRRGESLTRDEFVALGRTLIRVGLIR